MILLPAIDLKDGRCVRLKKGEFSTVSQVADSALRTAQAFADAGAKWVHMVDLDGARDGVRQNFPIIYEVIQQSGLSVELGGGIKSELDVITIGEAGAGRIATDGMLSGPSFDQLAALQKAVKCNIVASGGVTTLDDVKRLRDMGLYGAIIGKACYAGTLDLAEAVREAGPQA